MKKINKIIFTALAISLLGPIFALAFSPQTINLGTSGNYVILAKTGISTTGTTAVVGNIGVSPAQASYITGFGLILPSASPFSTSSLVTGKIYAPGYANPTASNLTTAVLDMQSAYTDGAGRAANFTELGAGNIGGLTLSPGVYKWGTGVLISSDVTISGTANDIWIFQIAQNLEISSGKKIILAGGANAKNIFWIVGGQTIINTTAVFNGNILCKTAVIMKTGARLNGRALAQSAVTLDSNSVTIPATLATSPVVPVTPALITTNEAAAPTPTTTATTIPIRVLPIPTTDQPVSSSTTTNLSTTALILPVPVVGQPTFPVHTISSTTPSVLTDHEQLDELFSTLQTLQVQNELQNKVLPPVYNNEVRSIYTNLIQGDRNDLVKILQEFLISEDKGSASVALSSVGATGYFGDLTRSALTEFQTVVGIIPALGYFGPVTREYLKTNY